jgi:hypothetical protein
LSQISSAFQIIIGGPFDVWLTTTAEGTKNDCGKCRTCRR